MTITGNKQLDFQINRFTSDFQNDSSIQSDLKDMKKSIKDLNSWCIWWSESAEKKEKEQKFNIAANYYKAAMFYLTNEDLRKKELYEGFIRCFYKGFHTFKYERYKVAYKNSFLPALFLKNQNADKTLLVIGGFDGYLEEVATFFKYMKGTNYNILIFDGPGQGNTSSRGMRFIPNFEQPVSVILDYFKLPRVDAIGLSWGGYFVLRAAAFEKRIDKVVAMDIFYTPMDTLKMNLGISKYWVLKLLLKFKAKRLLNSIIQKVICKDIDLKWKVKNGCQITGEDNAYDLIRNLQRYNTGKIIKFVNQECLLLAGEEDQYVPVRRLQKIKKELIHSENIQTHLFTRETGGEQHCQVGRMDLAFEIIKKFLGIK
ncbi:alpha/beta fold hydrolase [Clostridium sp. JNZ X4-2]